ncbi:nuclear pore complex protein Nup50 [Planococcus citri]|uniref:nuclear pore complex protein Nup50 n=1 Tax=Planococcus citri TaxID=170843 RepID=UPI0031F9DECB
MAAKRRALTQLDHRTFDIDEPDDPEEPEEVSRLATDDVLRTRVIRTAKRRGVAPSNEEGKTSSTKPLFSGFSGFSSADSNNGPKTFSFLSSSKSSDSNQAGDSKPSSFSFLSKSTNSDTVKSTANEPTSFLSKPELPNGNACKKSFLTSEITSKTTTSTSDENKLSFFAPDKTNNESNDKPSIKNTSSTGSSDNSTEDLFLRKLKSLNLLCAEWILEHLNENPHCILTPVFDDYKKHLNQLREERKAKTASSLSTFKRAKVETKVEAEVTPPPAAPFKAPDFKESLSKVNFGTSFFSKPLPQSQSDLQFVIGNTETKPYDFKKSTKSEPDKQVFKPTCATSAFVFGSNASSSDSKTDKTGESDEPKAAPAFSFTAKNPFFNASAISTAIPTTTESSKPAENNEDNEDQPPVLEDASITEEGSVFDKKCKVFIRKDGKFVDHGVGFAFLKEVGDEKKCQLIVRANNKLANIIINVLISSNIPIQKQGENHVMIVCCPTPDAKPSAVLIKVKTSEDADQLLELMNKLKK